MQESIKSLVNIGLSDKQATVYTALLELGEAKMTHIARHAKLKRPTVYLIIEELLALALVSMVGKGKKKIYSAVHPNRIAEILESRKTQFQELLPTLIARFGSVRGKPKVQMLEGMDGIRTAYHEAYALLKEQKNGIGNEGLWFGNISFLLEHFPGVIKEYDKVLEALKIYSIRELIIGGKESKTWVEKMQLNPKEGHTIKYLNDQSACGITDQFIIGNKIMLFSMSTTELFTLIIESEEIVKTQRFLFNTLWKSI